MSESQRYSVISTGKLREGIDADAVKQSLAKLFKQEESKVAKLLQAKCTIKKGLQHKEAYVYKKKLEDIGLLVELKRFKLPSAKPKLEVNADADEKNIQKPKQTKSLSLEPMTPSVDQEILANNKENAKAASGALQLTLAPLANEQENSSSSGAPASSPNFSPSSIACPKCGADQTQSFQCTECGVFIGKLLKAEQEGEDINEEQSRSGSNIVGSEEVEELTDQLKLKTIMAGCVAALLGAFLWKFIAVTFDYEIGLIAWGIGGAIGFAVALTGAQGEKTAIFCGVLALVSIMGGKYMAVEVFKNEWNTLFDDPEMYRVAYEEEKSISTYYVEEVHDETSMKVFMVEFAYTEAYSAQNVGDDELMEFKQSTDPRLRRLASNTMSFEEWKILSMAEVQNLSTWSILKENIGVLDVLFLFLGIGTAYQLALGRGML